MDINWNNTPYEPDKHKSNLRIYRRIKNEAKVECVGVNECNYMYKILDNHGKLSDNSLALICSQGSLQYGYFILGDLFLIRTVQHSTIFKENLDIIRRI